MPHDTPKPKTDRSEGRSIQSSQYSRVTSLLTSGLSFTSVQVASAHWLADAVHLWRGQVKTDALSHFNHRAMLRQDLFEIRSEQSLSTGPKQLVCWGIKSRHKLQAPCAAAAGWLHQAVKYIETRCLQMEVHHELPVMRTIAKILSPKYIYSSAVHHDAEHCTVTQCTMQTNAWQNGMHDISQLMVPHWALNLGSESHLPWLWSYQLWNILRMVNSFEMF